MLGAITRPLARTSHYTRRSFVSTVLLTKSYENEPVTKLRQELKARGLSQSGNKTTLITRIQENDKNRTLEAISSRNASTAPTPAAAITENVTPGIPPQVQHTSLTVPSFLNVRIPDAYQPPKPRTVQIPFVPDLWDSSSKQAAEIPDSQEPKLALMAGAETHPNGGPAYNSLEYIEASEAIPPTPQSQPPVSVEKDGFFADVLGNVKFMPDTSTGESQQSRSERSEKSRPLSREEKNGLWVLLGFFGGSWAVGHFYVHN